MLAYLFFANYLFSKRAGALVKLLAWFSILGITIGVAALIIVISVMNGMHANIKERITGIEPHVMWSVKGVGTELALRRTLAHRELSEEELQRSGIYERQDLIVRTVDGIFRGVVARGWDKSAWKTMTGEMSRQQSTSQTAFLDWLDLPLPGEGEVYIGYDLARVLGVIEGDPVYLIPAEEVLLPPTEVPEVETVTVKKIITTSLQDIDEGQIYFARGKALNRFRHSLSRELGMELWTTDPFRIDTLVSKLQMAGAQVSTWQDRNSSLFFALSVEKTAIGLFLSLSALISSFSIVILLTLLLSQKKDDVAILMTMGLSTFRTQQVFAGVGFMLSFMGIAAGVVIGVTVSLLIEMYPLNVLPTDIYYDSHLPSQLDWGFVWTVLGCAFVVSSLSSWAPVKFLSTFRPVEILRR